MLHIQYLTFLDKYVLLYLAGIIMTIVTIIL